MYQRILAAIDESATSELALKEAALLAKQNDATLRLAHVIDNTVTYTAYAASLPPRMSQPIGPVDRQAALSLQAAAEAGLRRFGENVLSRGAAAARVLGANVETTLLTTIESDGRVYDSIEQEAKRWPADLVVIGTHGRRGFRRLILGSVAEGFIRITTKPVLLVRGSE
jgi:nucleotide-binding universal stress UspA family protein